MSSIEAVRRPFAVFFEESLAPWIAVELARPRADVVGTARLPVVENGLKLDLCVECLRPHDECICD